MKAKSIILFILGGLFVLCIPAYEDVGTTLTGIALAAICFYFGWRSIKKSKDPTPTTTTTTTTAQISDCTMPKETPTKETYEFLRIKLAGVTFKNDNKKSRQSILRAIKFRDGEFAEGINLELMPYEWEGQPAYGVLANGQQIGNIPKDMVPIVEENYSRILDFSHIEVYGGGRDENMNVKSYGCEITLRLKKIDTRVSG